MVITPEQKVPSLDFKQEPVEAWNEPDSKEESADFQEMWDICYDAFFSTRLLEGPACCWIFLD